jgi:hypothetical protein
MNTPRQGGLAQRSPEAKISRKQAKPQSPQSARSTPAEASHHRANHTMAGPIPAPRRATGAAGHPLSAAQRERFAPIVGPAATQAARVHTSTDAHAWAQHQQARAVADGVDIYFAGGEYRPGTLGGDTLIAHELVHVRQALLGRLHRPARWATVGAEQTATEAEADDAARQVTEEPAAEQVQKQTEETQPGADNQAAPPTTSPAAVTTAQATQTGTAVPEAAVGPAAESQVAVEGEAAAAIDQAAPKGALPADIPLMPEPQTALSPDEKRRVSGVQGRAAATTKSTATAPQPTEDVASAAKAVATPQAESNAQAAEAIVAELGDTVKPSVEIVALCDRIKKLIREKRPADEEGVIDSRPEEVASTAGGAVSGDVNKNVDSAKGSYGPIDSTPKGPQPQQPPGVDPLPAQAPTADVSAKAATPDAVPPEQVSLDGDTKQMEAKADQAGLNKESAQLVQGGPVAEARAARGEMGELSKDGPAEAIKQQNEALATADANMAALQLKALQSLRDARAGHVAGVGTQQQELKGGAEDLRTRLSNKAQGIYDSAQTRVQDLLRDVPTTAMDKWTKGLPPISRQFKADLKVVADRVDERHSGVGGFFVAGWDAVSGLPDWATDAYDKAEKDFGDSVCTLITGISVYVNQIIKIADEIIADARKEISAVFKAELPEADAAWAAEQEKAFGHKLDALHDKAEETRTSFNKELIDNAGGAVQSAREEIQKLRKKAGGLWGRFLDAVGRFLDDPVKFIIDGLLELVGISPPAFWALVKKIEKVLTDIVDAPIRFANNLMDGVAKGFSLFFDNIGIHLVTGLLEWLLSGLKDEGIPIQVPKEFSVKSVIGFFLELLGVSWSRIRKLLVEQLGEKPVAIMEKTAGLFATLFSKGIGGILDDIKQFLDPDNIVNTIVDVAVKYITQTLIVKVAAKILLMFNPAGAIYAAIEAIYRVLKWIFTNAAKLFHFVEAIVNGIADILNGNIGGVAKTVEAALAMLVAPVIDFLADYLGLGGLPGKVANAVKGMQAWVEGVMRSVIKWLVEMGRKIMRALGIGGKEDHRKKTAEDTELGRTIRFSAAGESHSLYVQKEGNSAHLMVASTPTTIAEWIVRWQAKLAQGKPAPDSPERTEAESLIGELGPATRAAESAATGLIAGFEAAAADPEHKEHPPDDSEVEAKEQLIATKLDRLFELFGEDDVRKNLQAIRAALPDAGVRRGEAVMARWRQDTIGVPRVKPIDGKESPVWDTATFDASVVRPTEVLASSDNQTSLLPYFKRADHPIPSPQFTAFAFEDPGAGHPVRAAFLNGMGRRVAAKMRGDALRALAETAADELLAAIPSITFTADLDIGTFTHPFHAPLEVLVKGLFAGADFIAVLEAIVQGPVSGVSFAELKVAVQGRRSSYEWMKEELRRVQLGQHEWIPRSTMMKVLEFAADLHSQGDTLGAVGWVRLLGSLRSPTNAVIFKLRFLPVTVIRAPGDVAERQIPDAKAHAGAAYFDPDRQRIQSTFRAEGLVTRGRRRGELKRGVGGGITEGTSTFHDALEKFFTDNAASMKPAAWVDALLAYLPQIMYTGDVTGLSSDDLEERMNMFVTGPLPSDVTNGNMTVGQFADYAASRWHQIQSDFQNAKSGLPK